MKSIQGASGTEYDTLKEAIDAGETKITIKNDITDQVKVN